MRQLIILAALISTPVFAQQAKHESPLKTILPPDDQEKIRTERSLTIGIPVVDPYNLPGQVQWRPTGKLLLGVGFDSSLENPNDTNLPHGYELHAHQQSATAYFQYYPLKNSGFYIGAGGEQRSGTYTVAKPTTDGSDPVTVEKGTYTAVYAGPVFGLAWIWDNGITAGFDVSKRKRFSGKVSATYADATAPATLQSDVSDRVTPDGVLGTFMLGFSF